MNDTDATTRISAGAVTVMSLFAFWSGALGVGFAVVAVVGADELTVPRQLLYALLSVFLLLSAVRTAYELVRRMRRKE